MARISAGTSGRKRNAFTELLLNLDVANFVHGEPELRHHLLEGQATVGAPTEVLARSRYCLAVLFGQRIFVATSHDLQQPGLSCASRSWACCLASKPGNIASSCASAILFRRDRPETSQTIPPCRPGATGARAMWRWFTTPPPKEKEPPDSRKPDPVLEGRAMKSHGAPRPGLNPGRGVPSGRGGRASGEDRRPEYPDPARAAWISPPARLNRQSPHPERACRSVPAPSHAENR